MSKYTVPVLLATLNAVLEKAKISPAKQCRCSSQPASGEYNVEIQLLNPPQKCAMAALDTWRENLFPGKTNEDLWEMGIRLVFAYNHRSAFSTEALKEAVNDLSDD